MAAELGPRFSLASALRDGMLPLVLAAPDPQAALRAYAALYLREEVQAEGLVRNLGAFSRFLEAASFSHGAVLNVANVARECRVERKVVEGYVGILEDLLLAFRLPVFARRAKRETTAHPKLYLFDAGVFRSIRPAGPLDRPEEIEGAALEGLIAQHLRAWAAYRDAGDALHFWRTPAGVEVDFVVYGPETFTAIEVKNTARVRPEDLRGLRAFRADHPQAGAVLLYRGLDRLDLNGVLAVPCEPFLRALTPATSLDAAVAAQP
jgi:predicted AAA+ superfamily ATPase